MLHSPFKEYEMLPFIITKVCTFLCLILGVILFINSERVYEVGDDNYSLTLFVIGLLSFGGFIYFN